MLVLKEIKQDQYLGGVLELLEIYHNFQKYNSLIYVRREKRLSKRYKKKFTKK